MERKSKTQRKRDALSLQELGEKLTRVTEQQFKGMGLPEDIMREVRLARGISSHGGRKRQMQYLGVLMRRLEDVEPVRGALEQIEEGQAAATKHHQQIESWRDELVNGDDHILEEVLRKFPDADRARLVKLAQDAREQKTRSRPSPAASRALFRYLFSLIR